MTQGQPTELYRLGTQALQVGNFEQALSFLQKAVAANPDYADAHATIGNALFSLNRFADSIEAYRRYIALSTPSSNTDHTAQAHFNIGNAQLNMGDTQDAVFSYQTALSLTPDYSDALNNLSVAYMQLDNKEDALSCLKKAVVISPRHTQGHNNLGDIHLSLGHYEDAIACYQNVIRLEPGLIHAYVNLGIAYDNMERLNEAVASFKTAIELKPDYALTYFNLANVYRKLNEPDQAITCYETAIELDPNDANSYTNLGTLQRKLWRLPDAVTNLETAVRIRPDLNLAHGHLALALHLSGRVEEAIESHKKAVALSPTGADEHNNLIYTMQFLPEITGEAILKESVKWDSLYSAAIPTTGYSNTPDPERRLRVGYISPDFKEHAAAYFLEPLLAAHDRDDVEVFCYAELGTPDSVTERFMEHADQWRLTLGRTDDELCNMIRHDQIDILVECAGRSTQNRLRAISQKPAPLQLNYLAMHGETTGMACMDYALTDTHQAPSRFQHQFSEKLLHVENGSLIFQPSAGWPDVAPPRNPTEAPVFACVGAPDRIDDTAIELWAQLLDMVPGASMLFKHNQYTDRKTCDAWQRRFARLNKWASFEGVEGGWKQHMDVYGRVDIVLDTYPMTGGTSSLIPLWMGVPVLILAPSFYSHRTSVSLLANAGMSEFISEDTGTYLKMAAELVQDRDRLTTLRHTLRDQLAASPICDAQNQTKEIEGVYRRIWKTWCHEQG